MMRKTASQVADQVLEKCGMPFRGDIKYFSKWLKDLQKQLRRETDPAIKKMLQGDVRQTSSSLKDFQRQQAAFEKQHGGNLDEVMAAATRGSKTPKLEPGDPRVDKILKDFGIL